MDDHAARGASQQSYLTAVPAEILLHITSSLTTPEYGNLRLSCKGIEATLYNAFSREFFSKRQFMLTEFSLQTLIDISKSRLSSCLKTVIFGVERPSRSFSRTPFPLTVDFARKRTRLVKQCVDHMTLISTGQDIEMLVEAFSNLGNLETVGMRDFYSRSRFRDAPNTSWKSYGASTFEQETGSQLEMPRHGFIAHSGLLDQESYLSRMFINLFRALGKAMRQPKSFELILGQCNLHDHAFNIPHYLVSTIQPVLSNLQSLFLDLSVESLPIQTVMNNSVVDCSNYYLKSFLKRTDQVSHLRLNFEPRREHHPDDIMSWMAQSSPANIAMQLVHDLPQTVDFHKLSQLDIGKMNIEPKVLLDVLRKYRKALHTLSFHRITLHEDGSTSGTDKANLWADFFGRLAKLDLQVTRINLSMLNQVTKDDLQRITFKESPISYTKRWAGPNLQNGLRDLAKQTVVNWPPERSDSSLNSLDSMDDDEVDPMELYDDDDGDDDDFTFDDDD